MCYHSVLIPLIKGFHSLTTLPPYDIIHSCYTIILHLRSSQFSVADVRKDIATMEEEKEQLLKRIERLKKKVAAVPMQAEMMEVARKLRKEKDR